MGEYSVTEGGVVELCVVAQGQLDSTFTTLIQTSDLTAVGKYTHRTQGKRVYIFQRKESQTLKESVSVIIANIS